MSEDRSWVKCPICETLLIKFKGWFVCPVQQQQHHDTPCSNYRCHSKAEVMYSSPIDPGFTPFCADHAAEQAVRFNAARGFVR